MAFDRVHYYLKTLPREEYDIFLRLDEPTMDLLMNFKNGQSVYGEAIEDLDSLEAAERNLRSMIPLEFQQFTFDLIIKYFTSNVRRITYGGEKIINTQES